MVLDPNTYLLKGSRYTFSFVQSAGTWLTYYSIDDITSRLQVSQGDLLSQVQVSDVKTGTFGLGGDQFDISFVYVGDGSDTVDSVATEISNDVGTWATELSYVGGQVGSTGVVVASETSDPLKAAKDSLLPSTGALWAVAVALVVVAFLASGGAGIVRNATA